MLCDIRRLACRKSPVRDPPFSYPGSEPPRLAEVDTADSQRLLSEEMTDVFAMQYSSYGLPGDPLFLPLVHLEADAELILAGRPGHFRRKIEHPGNREKGLVQGRHGDTKPLPQSQFRFDPPLHPAE